jgi:hypothetical protein
MKYPSVEKILAALPQLSAEEVPNGLKISVSLDQREDLDPEKSWEEGFEYLLSNGWDAIPPEEIGALTDAPIIGHAERDERGEMVDAYDIYWYPEYELKNPIEELKKNGEVIFTKAA